MTIQCIFPTELISEILSYASPLDVVRWRTVSKWFCTITHDFDIWRALYANAHFLRPPGPFPTVNFERTFVQSARLARSWTTQPLRAVSCVSVPFDGCVAEECYLVGGRWLVVCQLYRRFVLYDTKAGTETRAPQVLWEQREDITAWDMCLATSEEGQSVVYVLLSTEAPARWALLEFRLDAESGVLCDTVTLDVPVSDVDRFLGFGGALGQSLYAHSSSRFLVILDQNLAFDTRTRMFYEFPELCIALDTTRSWPLGPLNGIVVKVVPTTTHVIFLRDFAARWKEPCTVVQAFTVPDDQWPVENGKGQLRLSHEGVFSSLGATVFAIIRNSVVDPITGVISVRLLERPTHSDGFRATCIDLALDTPSPVNVSPITIDRHLVLIKGDVPTNDWLGFCHEYYDISDDGYARGLFTQGPHHTPTKTCGVVKFTVDATQDRCVAVLSQFPSVEWPLTNSSGENVISALLDGARGKLAYVNDEDSCVVVVDIK